MTKTILHTAFSVAFILCVVAFIGYESVNMGYSQIDTLFNSTGNKVLIGLSVFVILRNMLFLSFSAYDYFSRKLIKIKNIPNFANEQYPPVSVIIPAFNEESVLEASIKSVLSCDYPTLNVIAVDDKSTDTTLSIIEALSRQDPRVKAVSKKVNGGKADAINSGIKNTHDEYVVIVDADTILKKDAIKKLIEPILLDKKITSVAGNVKVGNRQNLLTKLQSIEYIIGLNLARRTQHVLGCITTVPGAASLWRKSAIVELGGVPSDTKVEDTDLSILALREGHKIVYAPQAIAYTEAPITLKGLIAQRTRWMGGYLQAIFKHKKAFTEGGVLGYFGMPDLVYCNLLCFVLLPVMALIGLSDIENIILLETLYITAIYLGYEIIISAMAYLEDSENLKELILVPLAKLIWPWFLFLVFLKVVIVKVTTGDIPWLSADRNGTLAKNYILDHQAK